MDEPIAELDLVRSAIKQLARAGIGNKLWQGPRSLMEQVCLGLVAPRAKTGQVLASVQNEPGASTLTITDVRRVARSIRWAYGEALQRRRHRTLMTLLGHGPASTATILRERVAATISAFQKTGRCQVLVDALPHEDLVWLGEMLVVDPSDQPLRIAEEHLTKQIEGGVDVRRLREFCRVFRVQYAALSGID